MTPLELKLTLQHHADPIVVFKWPNSEDRKRKEEERRKNVVKRRAEEKRGKQVM